MREKVELLDTLFCMLVKLVISNALLCQQSDLINIKKKKKKKYVYDVLLNAFMEEAERNEQYLKKLKLLPRVW